MTLTTSTSVSTHMMTEILAQLALQPLRHKFAILGFLNASNIDGQPSGTRKIAKRTEIAEAVDDVEGAEFTDFEEYAYGTPVSLVPTAKVQGIAPTVKSLRKVMPGATREQVIQAIENNNPALIPALAEMFLEIIQSHYRLAERSAGEALTGLSESAGTTNTVLSFATLIDGQTELFDNRPEHRTIVAIVDEIGVSHLKKEILSASSGLAAMWGSGYGNEFLSSLGVEEKGMSIAAAGNLLGMPVVAGDASLMDDANASVDRVGGIICVGRGETAAPGSMRGFAELCEGHALGMSLKLDARADVAEAIGRYEWLIGEHTDEHGVKLIYRAT
jgi:hypothetical protein